MTDAEIRACATAYIDGTLRLTKSAVTPAQREAAIEKVVAWTNEIREATRQWT